MRVFVTGGSGVLGRATIPLVRSVGHYVFAPTREALNLLDGQALKEAMSNFDAVLHLATRIPPFSMRDRAEAWMENDRLRSTVSRLLVDAALADQTEVFVVPTVAFIYPRAFIADESTPVGSVPAYRQSALVAEREAIRFASAGRRGIVLRLGYLYGLGTGSSEPRDPALHVRGAGTALAVALTAPTGLYNVVDDAQSVSNGRFTQATGWRPPGDATSDADHP